MEKRGEKKRERRQEVRRCRQEEGDEGKNKGRRNY